MHGVGQYPPGFLVVSQNNSQGSVYIFPDAEISFLWLKAIRTHQREREREEAVSMERRKKDWFLPKA